MLYYIQKMYNLIKGATGNNEDLSFEAMITESVQERVVELGHVYLQEYNLATFGSGTSQWLYIKTPPTGLVTHPPSSVTTTDSSFNKDSALRISFYEGATVSDVGADTGIIITNLNRRSENETSLIIKSNPTRVDNGTEISRRVTVEGSFFSVASLQLKADTVYLMEIANIGTETLNLSLANIFYELED